MYINGLIDFPASRLFNVTSSSPSLRLKNTAGEWVKIRGSYVYDVRQANMRRAIVDDALYGMASGLFNGVFIDRANWASAGKCVPAGERAEARGGSGGGEERDAGKKGGTWDKATCKVRGGRRGGC